MITRERIQKFWEWCGLSKRGGYWWYDSSGKHLTSEVPPIDLNNLFKYAVPKLLEREGCEVALTKYPDEDHWNGCLWTNVEPFIDINEEDKDPATALFLAIEKVFND